MLFRTFTTVSSIILAAALVAGCKGEKPNVESDPGQTLAGRIAAGATVIDVRTVAEYESGHFPGAKNIPISQLEARMAEVGAKDADIVLYCKSGARSGQAQGILAAAGYSKLTNAGGLVDMPAPEAVERARAGN